MKHLVLILALTTMNAATALAQEDRAVANADDSQQYEVATYEYSARSFFEPKTEADLSALVSLDNDLEKTLSQEDFN
jgi:hypothetical protein